MGAEFDVLIVGGGHAGAQAAISLRKFGFGGSIAIVGAEADAPYDRPPLSKDYLAGAKTFDRMLLRPLQFWADQKVELMLGRTIVALDPAARVARADDGADFVYKDLIWAAGAR
ncbi:MAG: FAD-dependent oxidoreductase, partial [Rhodomicrobium sp.]|nr:FAD-dependent oxidoreductase [Rhodomicrobium sp.]